MSYMKDIALDERGSTTPIYRTPRQQRREDNGARISAIMRLVRAGKTMAEAVELVDSKNT